MAKNAADLANPTRKNGNHKNGAAKPGLRFGRYFTPEGSHAYDLIEWERRTAAITGEKGQLIFEQKDVEVPRSWSQLAINVVAQKYFHGSPDSQERETSVRQIIDRVVETLKKWGLEGAYFATDEDAENWAQELRFLLVTQHASFNSPVWFNLGVPGRSQQGSACFINSVQDSMESILELVKTEGMLFKFGSGTGTNLSVLRSSKEQLSGGGTASGPVSFMKGYDSFAGSIKSGGTTRRAAKMVILNADHPDVLDFIRAKAEEEKKAWALIEAGYNVGFNVPGGAYDSVQSQNANHSVRVTDDFMRAVTDDKQWTTKAVVDGRVIDTYKARDVWKEIAEAAWICGDPGLQFDSTIQDWNVVPNTGRINATNPCSEFVFLDDTACNLLSLNLMKFQTEEGPVDVDRLRRAIDVCFTGQEIIVSNASYPTPAIAKNSEALRPLGLGYANLGALLMSMGLAYDSDEGRRFAGAITAIMTGRAFVQSARMAQVKGPFSEYAKNREPMLRVMEKHRQAAHQLPTSPESAEVVDAARETWDEAVKLGRLHGYRNAQATVLAPTGTIGLMMDCDTTGIEPDLALVKYRKLVGGGSLQIVNKAVPRALRSLGYPDEQVEAIIEYISEHGHVVSAPGLRTEHYSVFDCAMGERSIAPMGHVCMMAAVQPFISGAISKTVNMPESATVEDVEKIYFEGWKLGLKALAIYRDNCKVGQPVADAKAALRAAAATESADDHKPVRRRLPRQRPATVTRFSVAGAEGYMTVSSYPDDGVGEVFLKLGKQGSTLAGVMDAFSIAISVGLQYGIPLDSYVAKFTNMRFEPAGLTDDPDIRLASSVMDYIFRRLALDHLSYEDRAELGILSAAERAAEVAGHDPAGLAEEVDPEELAQSAAVEQPPAERSAVPAPAQAQAQPAAAPFPPGPHSTAELIESQQGRTADAPLCLTCGTKMRPAGSCYVCEGCGSTSGCS